MNVILAVLHAGQAAGSAYATYNAYISIVNMQNYEEKSKRAAKYSNIAEEQLWKTRKTLASAAAACILSLAASIYCETMALTSASSSPASKVGLVFNVANIVTTLAARAHVSNFWHAKAKVPLVDAYNEAITTANVVVTQLGYLAAAWAASTALAAWNIASS